MDDASIYHFDDFTRKNYRTLLIKAREKYIFRSFTDFIPKERFILWRHDVDLSVHAAYRLAMIEVEEGIRSTYFFHLHNTFYNLFEKEVTNRCREIIRAGHNVGLHFDPSFYDISNEQDLKKYLLREKKIFEDAFSVKVRVFSFHNPTPEVMQYNKLTYCGMINTYSAFFQTKVGYCSDSNGYWRYRRLEDVLSSAEDRCLQILTHPEWWQDEPMSPYDRVLRCVNGRAEKTKKIYQDLLLNLGRENIGWKNSKAKE